MKKEIRPIISTKTYEKVTKLLDLQVQIGFDKSLNIILKRYIELEKFYKKNLKMGKASPTPTSHELSTNQTGDLSL